MAHNFSQNAVDRDRVDVNKHFEVSWWCKKWGCKEIELRAAVLMVGTTAENVEAVLLKEGVKRN
jgi:hypothetical protein